jgi:hypothetical protein
MGVGQCVECGLTSETDVEKSCYSAAVSTSNPICFLMGSQPGCRCAKQPSNCLEYGTASFQLSAI